MGNPWITIWIKPRATIRQILDTDPKRMVLWLAIAGSFAAGLERASIQNLGDKLPIPAILILSALGGLVGGPLTLYLGGALLKWTGRWIGGQATAPEVRAALGWANVPLIWGLLLWIPEGALLGPELFTSQATRIIEGNPSLGIALMGLGVVEVVLGIWGFVVLLKCLAEAERFSAWKGLGNLLLAGGIVVVPLILITLLVTAIL